MTLLEQNRWTPEKREILFKRLTTERRELLSRIVGAERALKAMLDHFTGTITQKVLNRAGEQKNLKSINEKIHQEIVYLRSSMRIWCHAAIRDAAKMGFRHMGDALAPIFKHNAEAYEQAVVAGRALFEAKLVFGLKKDFARRNRYGLAASLSTAKWSDAQGRVVRAVTKQSLTGLNPSERIWDLTTRAEQDLKRIVANGMGAGDHPSVIARKLKKYISPDVTDASKLGIEPGLGIYRSPYKNALRLTRTEMMNSYTKATLTFTNDKAWVVGYQINLSRVHDQSDQCDENAAGGPYSKAQAEELVPAHPHCMCLITPIIDQKYLGNDEPAPEGE